MCGVARHTICFKTIKISAERFNQRDLLNILYVSMFQERPWIMIPLA